MSSLLSFIAFAFCLFSCAPVTASALPWPSEEQHSTRSWAGHAPRSTTSTTKTGMPAWQIAVISLGLFFGVMALGMIGGALEVLLHTRKKVADPDPAPSDLDFGSRSADTDANEGGEKEVKEGEDSDDDGATAVNGEGSTDGDENEKQGKQEGRFSWQDEQGVQMEVWNEGGDASREMEQDVSQDHGLEAHDGMSAEYPQQPEPAYARAQYEADHEDENYPHYQPEDLGAYAEGHEGHYGQPEESEYDQQQQDVHNGYQHEEMEAHDEVQDVHGQRMTRYEPWVPQMEDEFHEIPLPEHGSQSETTHQQHPAEYI